MTDLHPKPQIVTDQTPKAQAQPQPQPPVQQQTKDSPVSSTVNKVGDKLYFVFQTKPTAVSNEFFQTVITANNGDQNMAIAALMHHVGVHYAKNILEYVEGIRGGVKIPVVESPAS